MIEFAPAQQEVILNISELSVKQYISTRNFPGVIFIPKIGRMIRPKTVSYLVDGYTPINNLWDGRERRNMKTEDLQGKGLNQEQIDFVMAEYGKDLNAVKAERDGYKSQLDTAQASLKAMEGIDAAALQTKISNLTTQLQGKETEIEKIKSDYAFDASVKEAIRNASGRNEKAIMALLDVDTLKASENQAQDIEAAITALKKDNDYLFQPAAQIPRVVSSTTGINNDAQTKKEQANEALRSLLGKGE